MTANERTYLPLRRINWGLVTGFVAMVTICLTAYRQLNYLANGEHRPLLLTFLEEAAGGLAGFTVFAPAYLVATRFPLLSLSWRRNLLIQLAALCGISVVHTSLIVLFRAILLPPFGYGDVSYGYLPLRYPMEFAHLFIFYWVGVALIYFFHEVSFRRDRELSEARLVATLAEAQAQNLRLQLEPHFLFNALNAISAALYEDPRIADEMIGRLSELLRQLLKTDRTQQVSLERELELLQLYLRVMQARFEHRLQVTFEIEDAVRVNTVPQLVLQPLVENAIRHGMDPVTFRIDITIEARRESDQLLLVVRDGGPGFSQAAPLHEGIGLRNTRERLRSLYGARQSVTVSNGEAGGAVASLLIPLFAGDRQPDHNGSLRK